MVFALFFLFTINTHWNVHLTIERCLILTICNLFKSTKPKVNLIRCVCMYFTGWLTHMKTDTRCSGKFTIKLHKNKHQPIDSKYSLCLSHARSVCSHEMCNSNGLKLQSKPFISNIKIILIQCYQQIIIFPLYFVFDCR